jgi:DNA repair protein RadC
MAIKDWPESQRPRERLLTRGAQSLTDAELLAIFFRVGVTGKSAIELANEALQHCGGLHGLLTVDEAAFTQISGLGSAKYAQLMAVMELARRGLRDQLQQTSTTLNHASAVQQYVQHILAHAQHEQVWGIFLNSQLTLIASQCLSQGSLEEAPIYPRELVKACFAHNAAALILAHNHPNGSQQPSDADIQLTHQLHEILHPLGIRLVDHLIVGGAMTGHAVSSMKILGLMPDKS